jgi:uncharacterized protein (UPF0212 family)
MSHRHDGAGPETANISADRDLATEQAIDALDYLRIQMRRAGLPDCADVLDEAFVMCLRAYVAHKRAALARSPEGALAETIN